MADVKIRFPYPDSTDPTHQLLVTMVDQGDGTFAPKISGNAATAAGGAPSDATYITKTANATLTAETAIGAGTAGQILQSDGTNPVYTDKSVSEAQVATTDVTTGDATTTKHGFLKKLGAAAKILQSDGTAQQWVTEPAADLVAAAGDMLIGTAVDTLGRVAIGTSGKVWQSDGTTAAWQTPAAAGTAGTTVLLSTALASDISNSAISAGGTLDVIANQNFTVASATSIIEIVVRAYGFCADNVSGNQYFSQIVVDSAGTPITTQLSGTSDGSAVANVRSNALGCGSIFISGLTAAVHTVKLRVGASQADHFYCRASTNGPTGGAEFAAIQVIEHKN